MTSEWHGLTAQQLQDRLLSIRRRASVLNWELGMGLVEMERTRAYLEFAFNSLVAYAWAILELHPQKCRELLRACKTLQRTPIMAEAFRTGALSWSRVRELTRHVTAENDARLTELGRNKRRRSYRNNSPSLLPRPGRRRAAPVKRLGRTMNHPGRAPLPLLLGRTLVGWPHRKDLRSTKSGQPRQLLLWRPKVRRPVAHPTRHPRSRLQCLARAREATKGTTPWCPPSGLGSWRQRHPLMPHTVPQRTRRKRTESIQSWNSRKYAPSISRKSTRHHLKSHFQPGSPGRLVDPKRELGPTSPKPLPSLSI